MGCTRRDLLASGGSAALLVLTQTGTTATERSPEKPLGRVVYASQWNLAADALTDDTAIVQAVIDAHAGMDIVFDGTMAITSTVTVSHDKTRLIFRNGAGFTYSTPTMIGLKISGDDVTLEGLNFTAPATFDGINATPNYGVIWVTGNNCKVLGGKISNVPKVGIMFSECEGALVSQMMIEGNFPATKFTGTEVSHAAIIIDAAARGRQGNFIIESNDIAECVQGILIANYGESSRSQGIIITGNNFYRCWNHGVYGAGINYANSVTSNVFINCQVPIALSGGYHVVSGNSITTGGSTGTFTDEVGISLRDPVHCIVANNIVQGETGTDQAVINLMTSLGSVVRGNIVSGNTMEITGMGSANLIRLGGLNCTDLTDNQVLGNTCVGVGINQSGLIQLAGGASCTAHGTIISSNSAVAKSASHGIQLVNLHGASVVQNQTRLEHDSASEVQLAGIALSNCSACEVNGNSISALAAWGKSVVLVGVWEAGSSSGNRASNNTFRAEVPKLTAAIHYMTVNGSGILVDDVGSGAPEFNAGVGSSWRRTDGAANTTIYIKESGAGATGWVGK